MTATWALAHRADDSAASAYSFVGARDGWQREPGTGLEARDLGLGTSSGGRIDAVHRRNGTGASVELLAPQAAAARFLVVLADAIEVEQPGGSGTALHEHGFAYLPPATEHTVVLQPGSEILEISVPARSVDAVGGDTVPLPPDPVLEDDVASDWVVGGLRSFFRYRHFPTDEITDGLVGLQLSEVIAPCPEGGTGFHHHTSSQIFYVLSGWVDLAMEGVGVVRVDSGDAVCIPGDVYARHNVAAFSPDYAIVEMFLPASYRTFVAAAPAGLG